MAKYPAKIDGANLVKHRNAGPPHPTSAGWKNRIEFGGPARPLMPLLGRQGNNHEAWKSGNTDVFGKTDDNSRAIAVLLVAGRNVFRQIDGEDVADV